MAPAKTQRKVKRVKFAIRFARRQKENVKFKGKRWYWWHKRIAAWREVRVRLEKQLENELGERKIIPRSAWDDNPGDRATVRMANESEGLFAHHSVSGSPTTIEGEKAEMRNLERIARSRGFADFSYSYAIAPSGRIYEGRGRGIVGAHTVGYNSTAHAAVAMGNYDSQEPSAAMIESFKWLRGYLNASKFRGHRDVNPTACPGRHLYGKLF
jgi:hypothetical protein